VTDRRAPPEPSRRVTPNRDGGKTDLVPQRGRRADGAGNRGRIIDLFV
jgi:hypothetical protein